MSLRLFWFCCCCESRGGEDVFYFWRIYKKHQGLVWGQIVDVVACFIVLFINLFFPLLTPHSPEQIVGFR